MFKNLFAIIPATCRHRLDLPSAPASATVAAMPNRALHRSRFRRRRPGRVRDVVVALCAILLLALAVSWLEARNAETVAGKMRVVDGDSLTFGDRRLRLSGIDAPEIGQDCRLGGKDTECGRLAMRHLGALIDGARVTCRLSGRDRYGRDLADCRTETIHLNAEMVRSGHAMAYGGYEAEERRARAERAGLWAGRFEAPSDWRRTHGGLDEPVHGSFNGIGAVLKRLFGSE